MPHRLIELTSKGRRLGNSVADGLIFVKYCDRARISLYSRHTFVTGTVKEEESDYSFI